MSTQIEQAPKPKAKKVNVAKVGAKAGSTCENVADVITTGGLALVVAVGCGMFGIGRGVLKATGRATKPFTEKAVERLAALAAAASEEEEEGEE